MRKLVATAAACAYLLLPAAESAFARHPSGEARREAAKQHADTHRAKQIEKIDEFVAAEEEKKAAAEGRWGRMMDQVDRPNDQGTCWSPF